MTYSEREFGASQSDYPKEQQMSDIVERLRKLASIYADPDIDGALWKERDLLTEAAAEIERLRAGRADPEAVEAARRILKPFKRERPTVAELEAILRAPDGAPVTINPDGSIGVGDTDAVKVATALLASTAREAKLREVVETLADALTWCTENDGECLGDHQKRLAVYVELLAAYKFSAALADKETT